MILAHDANPEGSNFRKGQVNYVFGALEEPDVEALMRIGGRDNATLLTQLKYASKLGIPLVSGKRGKCPVRIRSGSRSDFQIISEMEGSFPDLVQSFRDRHSK
jgi:hypothetical protein